MHVHLTTLGCRLNEAETELWSGQFQAAGWTLCAEPSHADLIIFNSCAVTAEAVRKSRQLIGRHKRINPNARVVISGCVVSLPQDAAGSASPNKTVGKKELSSQSTGTAHPVLPEVDLIVPNNRKDQLVRLTLEALFPAVAVQQSTAQSFTTDQAQSDKTPASSDAAGSEQAYFSQRVIPLYPASSTQADVQQDIANTSGSSDKSKQRRRQRAFIKIQDGCRYKCTYCIVTQARGEEKSRRIQTLIDEVNTLQQQGVQEIVLTGVHVGGYGSDTNESLASLVGALLQDTAVPRIRFASVEPWDLEPDLLALFHNKRVMPHMHLPLQSGSDSVLKRMARRCRTADFRQLVESLRADFPDFNVTTDIIVGFPGETDDEWQETMAFAEEMAFGHIHIFPFSPRAGTHAATLAGQLPNAVKKQRARQLAAIARDSRHRYMQQFVGRTVNVLWETGQAIAQNEQLSPANGKRFIGYTPNYLRVCSDIASTNQAASSSAATAADTGRSLENLVTPARLEAIEADESRSNKPTWFSASVAQNTEMLQEETVFG